MELSKDYGMSNNVWLPVTELTSPLMFTLDVAGKGKVEISNFRCMAKGLYDTLTSQDVDRVDRYHISKIPMKASVYQ